MVKRFKFLANFEDADKATGAAFYVLASDYDALAAKIASMDGELNQAADESAAKAGGLREAEKRIVDLETILHKVRRRWKFTMNVLDDALQIEMDRVLGFATKKET